MFDCYRLQYQLYLCSRVALSVSLSHFSQSCFSVSFSSVTFYLFQISTTGFIIQLAKQVHTNAVMSFVFVAPLVQAPNFPELEGLGRFIRYQLALLLVPRTPTFSFGSFACLYVDRVCLCEMIFPLSLLSCIKHDLRNLRTTLCRSMYDYFNFIIVFSLHVLHFIQFSYNLYNCMYDCHPTVVIIVILPLFLSHTREFLL